MKHVKLFEEFVVDSNQENVNESLIGLASALATMGVGVLLRYYADAIVDGLHGIYKTVKSYIAPGEWDKVVVAAGKDEALNKKVLQMIENKEFMIVHATRRVKLIEELPEFKAFVEKNGIDERVANSIAVQMERTIWNHKGWITDKIKKKFNIKEAFEYGDQLLTDPDGVQFKDRLKALKLPEEPNTYDEQRFIEMLKDWFNNEQADGALGSVLWELLPLKKKFPKVLDPSKGRNLYDGTTLYRGTMLPLSKVLGLKGQWKKYNGVGLYGAAIEMDVKFKWDFKGDKGFTSFTPASETAEEFADSISYEEFKPLRPGYTVTKRLGEGSTGGKIPVILKIKDTHPQALFNPQFTTAISPFLSEWEIFLVGSSAIVEGIIIPRWDDYENTAIQLDVDLTKYFNLK